MSDERGMGRHAPFPGFIGGGGGGVRLVLVLEYGVQYVLDMKIREVIKRLEADGWYHVRTRGSHRQYKHPTKPGLVTVAGKPNDDLAPGTLRSILSQAQLDTNGK
jgi:predicted RNA binding protein YcfA (HicA-like mRNA interferase family)